MKYIKSYQTFETEASNEAYEIFDNSKGENFYGDHAAGILPVCLKTKRMLIGHRSEYVNEPNTWGIFGGKFEKSDYDEFDPEDVAKRELEEETGYSGQIDLIPAYIFKTANGNFTYYNYIGLVDYEFKPELNWENENTKWIHFNELENYNLHFGLTTLIENSGHLIKQYVSL